MSTAIVIDGRPEAQGVRHVPHPLHEYRKTATVMATQMDLEFVVETLEGTMTASAGDYLCIGPKGEAWPVKGSIFEDTYEPVSGWKGLG